ncbi:MAG: hypothetical protein WC162_01360 [Sphaerochaetaceae bacterium]|nr:hypothetical protein [Sphaerochaetaceae bacterium]
MTEKKLITVVLILVLSFSLCATDEPVAISNKDISKSFAVIVNSAITALACSMNEPVIELPSTSINISSNKDIPSRISFLLTDLYSYKQTLSEHIGNTNYILRLITGKESVKLSPLLFYLYSYLTQENYKTGQYLLSGNIYLYYNFSEEFTKLYQDVFSENEIDGNLYLVCDMTVQGSGVCQDINIKGSFELEILGNGDFKVSPVDIFYINGKKYSSEPIFYHVNFN